MDDTTKISILVIDLGTSNLKVMAFDTAYTVVADCSHPIKTTRDNGLAEQDAKDWMCALTHCLQTVCSVMIKDGYHLVGIGFTGHMSSPVFVNKNKEVIAPIQTLADQRCVPQVEQISKVLQSSIAHVTGNMLASYFTLPKIMWALQNDDKLLQNTHAILAPKDYLRLQLGGGFYSECSDCCNTLLLNYKTLDWHDHIIKDMGIDRIILPLLKKSFHVDGVLSPSWSHRLHLPYNIPLIMGASDMATALISCQSNKPNTIGVTLGSSLTVTMGCEAPATDLIGKVTFHISAQDTLFALGSHFNGGSCIDWFHTLLLQGKKLNPKAKHQHLRTLTKTALSTPVTLNDPIFIPHLLGAGSPDFNPHACGVFARLNAGHTHIDMMRAVLEGVTMDACKTISLLQKNSHNIIVAGGGGIYHMGWPQMLSDMSGLTVKVADNVQSSSLGCAIMTYNALGITTHQTIGYQSYTPNSDRHNLYQKRLALSKGL